MIRGSPGVGRGALWERGPAPGRGPGRGWVEGIVAGRFREFTRRFSDNLVVWSRKQDNNCKRVVANSSISTNVDPYGSGVGTDASRTWRMKSTGDRYPEHGRPSVARRAVAARIVGRDLRWIWRFVA